MTATARSPKDTAAPQTELHLKMLRTDAGLSASEERPQRRTRSPKARASVTSTSGQERFASRARGAEGRRLRHLLLTASHGQGAH